MKMTTRILTGALLASLLVQPLLPSVYAADQLHSLRGAEISAPDHESDLFKREKDRAPLPRNYEQQPPIIPHAIQSYNITLRFNKCLDCHSWDRAKETGATKVSKTHFKTRDGQELASISPRRYFCTTCHVPQTDAQPLVDNTFKRAEGMK